MVKTAPAATDSPMAGEIFGLLEAPVEDVVLTKVHIAAEKGMRIINAKGIRFVDCSIDVKSAPAIEASNAEVAGISLSTGR